MSQNIVQSNFNSSLIQNVMNKMYLNYIVHNEFIRLDCVEDIFSEFDKMSSLQLFEQYQEICLNIPNSVYNRDFYICSYIWLIIHYLHEDKLTQASKHIDKQLFQFLLHDCIPMCNDSGLYDESIISCKVCLNKANKLHLHIKERIELYFFYSKAERDKGNYNEALDLLCEIYPYTKNDEVKHYKGATLLRIAKVYQNYLMKGEIAHCFLEEAKLVIFTQLKDLEGSNEHNTLDYLNEQYSVCLDALGQYYLRKETAADLNKALAYFEEAAYRNQGTNRSNRNRAHIIHVKFILAQAMLINEEERRDIILEYIKELNCIITEIGNQLDHVGLAVRFLQLSSMYDYLDEVDDALCCLDLSIKYAEMYHHYKTLVNAHMRKLSYNKKPDENKKTIEYILPIIRKCHFFKYEIKLNNLQMNSCTETDKQKQLQYMLPFLQRNLSLYTQLHDLLKETINSYNLLFYNSNEVLDISDESKMLALNGVISEYNSYIDIITQIGADLIDAIKVL